MSLRDNPALEPSKALPPFRRSRTFFYALRTMPRPQISFLTRWLVIALRSAPRPLQSASQKWAMIIRSPSWRVLILTNSPSHAIVQSAAAEDRLKSGVIDFGIVAFIHREAGQNLDRVNRRPGKLRLHSLGINYFL